MKSNQIKGKGMEVLAQRIIEISSTITNPMEYGISPDLLGCVKINPNKYNLINTVLPKFEQVEGDRDDQNDDGYLISGIPCEIQSKKNGAILADAIIELDGSQVLWFDKNHNEIDDVTAWMPVS